MKRRKSAYGNGRRGCGSLRTRGAASSERYPWLGVGAPGTGCAPRRAREGLGGRVAMQRL